ncbi:GNAT family N-acetyltransferase [Actinopolymorpha sp. B9G3]|uniref:GNAT family N-acetyltransferase n=1 Tax=Actinopolymorpha sp. B9G3 TaxID=3158970 RepID=UPI0032D8C43C
MSEPTESSYVVRPATDSDADFIALMTLEAFNWDPDRTPFTMAQLLADPALAKYVEGWPAAGEEGVIAQTSGTASGGGPSATGAGPGSTRAGSGSTGPVSGSTDTGSGSIGTGPVPIGAAWWRYFSSAEPGYGYVADDVPEIGIAVVASWRGRGLGRALLRGIADRARAAGVSRLSLSVERANPAARLYASEGYEIVAVDESAETRVKHLR